MVALVVASAALAAAGCGSDDREEEPRPPVPAEISIQVTDDTLTVSPREFGAGIANFTIANLGDVPTGISIDGPTVGEADELPPGTTAALQMQMEPGDYEAVATGTNAEPFAFAVGPERESSSNDLLLP